MQVHSALGRDYDGGKSVNLIPSERPQDVYSKVLEIVIRKIDADSQLPPLPEQSSITATTDSNDVKLPTDVQNKKTKRPVDRGKLARMVKGIVNRKVIKQTVMTSVYGVTKIGARAQVQARYYNL